MRKKLKRLIALLLSLLMVISLIPTTGLAVEAAAKPKLVKKSVSIVIGESSQIKVKNAPKRAKVTYKSTKKNIATVSEKGKVKGLKSGTAKIIVSVKKHSKTTKLNYKVTVKRPALSKNTLSLITGNTANISIKNKPKKAAYAWRSSNPQVAAVHNNGKVKAKAVGTTTIQVKVQTAKKTYNLSCKVTVRSASDDKNQVKQNYTVTFNSNGGSSVASQTVEENALITQPVDPVRSGYTFDGWYTAEGSGQKFDFNTAVTGNIVLYARWTAITSEDSVTYTITFDSNGGSPVASQIVKKNALASRPTDPVRSGYNFNGWYLAKSGGKKFDFHTAVTENITLYAQWSSVFVGGNSGSGSSSSGSSGSGSSSGGSSGSGSSSGSNSVSCQAWISELLPAVGIDAGTNDIIEMARQYGLIDSGFSPVAATTEGFAVETAIRALGFSYSDLTECFQIANDVGLFTSTPTARNLTMAQKERIIARAKEISTPVNVPQKPEGEIVFPETTQMLVDTDLMKNSIHPATMDGGKGTLVLAAGKKYAKGECVILPVSEEYPNGLAQKIISVTENADGTVTLETEYPSLDEVMGASGKLNISGTVSGSEGTITPSDEILEELDIESQDINDSRIAAKGEVPKNSITSTKTGLTITFNTSNKLGIYGQLTVAKPSVKYKMDIDWRTQKINHFYLTTSNDWSFKGGLQMEGEYVRGEDQEPIKLGSWKIPLLATDPIIGQITKELVNLEIGVYLVVTAEGNIGITWRYSNTYGVQYINGHWRNIIGQGGNNIDFEPLEFKGKLGPRFACKLNVCNFDLLDLGYSFGDGIYSKVTHREADSLCADVRSYIYSEISLNVLPKIIEFAWTWEHWNEESSPFKLIGHYESTKEKSGWVPKCTFGYGILKGIVRGADTDESVADFNVIAEKTDTDGDYTPANAIVHQDGSFEFTNLMRGTYKLIIAAEKYQTFEQTGYFVLADEETNVGIIRLAPVPAESVVRGYVKDEVTKNSIKGAVVTFRNGESVDQSTETDDDGSFVFRNLPQGTYTVTVTADHYETTQRTGIEVLPGQDTELDVFFLKNHYGTVSGSVYDSVTGKGIDSATVTLRAANADTGEADVSVGVAADGSFTFEKVEAGAYTLTVAADGYETYQRTDLIVQAGQITSAGMICLVSNTESGTGSITGYIYDSVTNSGLGDATVTLYRGNGTNQPTDLYTTTATDGKYEFTDIAFGSYTITVQKSQYVDGFRSVIVSADKVDAQNVTLIPRNIIEGSSGFSFYSQLSPEAKTVYNAVLSSTNRNRLKTGEKIYVWESNAFTFRPLETDPETGEPIYGENWSSDYDNWWHNYVFSGAQDYLNVVNEAYEILYLDHPEIFWAGCIEYFWGVKVQENGGSWRVLDQSETYEPGRTYRSTVWVKFTLLDPWSSGRSISADESAIANQVDAIVGQIDKSGSRYEQLLQVHDWLTQNNTYNTSANDNIPWSALSALSTSYQPVCAGYANAFKMLCDRLNIPCVLVGGTGISNTGTERHMWNYVQMENGKWYAVDVTWDDPIGGSGNQSGFEHHGYFLVGSNTAVDGYSFTSSHQADVLNKPNGGSFVLPSLSADAYDASSMYSQDD